MSYQPPSTTSTSATTATAAALSLQSSSSTTEATVKSSMASTSAAAVGTAENPPPSTKNKLNSYNNNNHTEERNAVVLALFGPSVGRCIGDYATSYNRVNGRLYAATNAVLFYSNIFGFERRLMLDLADVETIESYRSTSIKITTVDCEDYVFRKFTNRDIVLTLLQRILHRHDNPQEQQQQQQQQTGNNIAEQINNGNNNTVAALDVNVGVPSNRHSPIPKRHRSYDDIAGGDENDKSLLRRPHVNSDVLPDITERRDEDRSVSPVSSFANVGVAANNTQPSTHTNNATAEATTATITSATTPTQASRRDNNNNNNLSRPAALASRGRSRSQPPPKKKKLKKSPSSLMKRTKSALSSLKRKGSSSVSSQISSDNSLQSSSSSSAGSSPAKFLLSSPSTGTRAGRDSIDPKNLAIIQAAWKQASVPYEEILLDTITLSCTLDKFMDLFLTDEAKFPIMKYQTEHIKDRNLKVSLWQKKKNQEREEVGNNNNSSNTTTEGGDIINVLERKIDFIHPLKNPVGPSEAKTARTQTFRRFHNFGMTLQNSTKIEGVPKADCFVVEDRWIFTKVSETQISFLVSFRMNFIKQTMLKSIIQKNTRSETKNWLRGYAAYVQDVLSSAEVEDQTTSRRKPKEAINQQTEIVSASRMPMLSSTHEPAVNTTETTLFDKMYKMGILILLSILVIQILILQKAVASMESRMVETHTQNAEILAALIELKQQQHQ